MFGYVTLYRKGLADAEMDRYQAYYCGCAGRWAAATDAPDSWH